MVHSECEIRQLLDATVAMDVTTAPETALS